MNIADMAEQLSRILMERRERFMREILARIIGPRCPVSAEDMMTVLWFRRMEADIVDDRKSLRFVVRAGSRVIFDGEMPSVKFDTDSQLPLREWMA